MKAPTLQEVYDWYLANLPRQFCAQALAERKRIMALFCAYRGPDGRGKPYGERPYTAFKPFQLLEFVKGQKGLKSQWSRRRWVTTLKTPLSEAVAHGLIDRNPFLGIRQAVGARGRDWTPAEYQALLRHAPAHFRRLLVFIRFSGARPGEARLAQWSMVNANAKVIVIRQHKTAHATGTPRRIRLNAVTLKLLVWIRRRQGGSCQRYIFPNKIGNAWSIRMIAELFDNIRKRARLPKDVKLHGARHMFATQALMNGLDLATLASLLGHQSVNTTQIYTHLVDKSEFLERAAAKAIGRSGSGPVPSIGILPSAPIDEPEAGSDVQAATQASLPTANDLPSIPRFRSSWRLCWAAAQQAFEEKPELRRATDADLLQWLKEYSPFGGWMPSRAETFSRHLSTARSAFKLCSKKESLRHPDPIGLIKRMLAGGPVRASDLRRHATQAGVPDYRLGKFATCAGARCRKVGGSGGYWVWELAGMSPEGNIGPKAVAEAGAAA